MKKKIIIASVVIAVLLAGGYGAYYYGMNYLFDKYVIDSTLSSIADMIEEESGIDINLSETEQDSGADPEPPEWSEEKELTQTETPQQQPETPKPDDDIPEQQEDATQPDDMEQPEEEMPENTLEGTGIKPFEPIDPNKQTEQLELPEFPALKQGTTENEVSGEGGDNPHVKEPGKKLSKSEIVNKVLKDSELSGIMSSMISAEDKRKVIKIVLSNFTTTEISEIAKNVSKGLTKEYKSKLISDVRSRMTSVQWKECVAIAYKYVEEMRPYVE